MVEKPCVRCDTPVGARTTGRPARYCSVGCRRAAEYEIRRLDRRIERLQEALDRLPLPDEPQPSRGSWEKRERERQERDRVRFSTLMAEAEVRLRVLLDEDTAMGRV